MGCVHSSKAERPKPHHQQQGYPPSKSRQNNRYSTQSGDRQLVSGGRQQLSSSVSASKDARHRPHQQSPPVPIQSIDKKVLPAQPASVHSGVKRSDSTSPTRDSGVDVASNSALNHQTSTAKTASAASLEAGNDLPFRRQDFDRNSVLRRSKKRRKSSSAGTSSTNINSPNKAVVSGDRDTSNTTPKKVEAAEKQPVNISNNNNNDRTQRRSSSQQGIFSVDHCSTSEVQRGSLNDTSTNTTSTSPVEVITGEPVTIASNLNGNVIGLNSRKISPNSKETFSASANVAALLNRGQQQPEENKGQLQSSQNRGHQQQSHQSLKMPLQPPPQPPKLPQKMPQQQQNQHDVLLPSQQQKPKTNSVASTNGLQEQHGHHHHLGLQQQRQQHARQQPQNREKLPNNNIDNMLIPSASNKSRRSSAPVPTAQELKSKQTAAAAAADGVVNSSNHSNRKWSAQYPNNTQALCNSTATFETFGKSPSVQKTTTNSSSARNMSEVVSTEHHSSCQQVNGGQGEGRRALRTRREAAEVGGTNGLNGVHVAADPSTGDDEDCGRLI